MSTKPKNALAATLLIIGMAPFALAACLITLMILAARKYGGGGDGIMMTMLSFSAYLLSCIVLIPSLVAARMWLRKRQAEPTRGLRVLIALAMFVVLGPPGYLILLANGFFR